MKFNITDIKWGGPESDWYYFCWWPNWLSRENRYVGLKRLYYDGPHITFGLWFFNIGWSTAYSIPAYEFCNEETKTKWRSRPTWWRRIWDMEEYVP